MTLTAAPPDQVPSPAPAQPSRRPSWLRRQRPGLLAVGGSLLLLLLVIVLTLVATGTSRGADLDPRSADPGGTLALAQLLRARGVTVDRGASVRPGGTLVVPFAGSLDEDELGRVLDGNRGAGRILLLSPFDVPDAGLTEDRFQGVSVRAPECALPAAQVAGSALVGGRSYSGGTSSCYGGSLVLGSAGGTPVVALGSPTLLTNAKLDEDGNAALALALTTGEGLGAEPTATQVIWYQPALDPQADRPGVISLLPRAVPWAVLQLALAAAVVALWRGRRLGPVVEEPLPVLVPAAETVQGRARLYAAGRARQAAAAAIRAGARDRLAALVHHGGNADPVGLVDAVAERSGRSPGEVAVLLYGSPGGSGSAPAPGSDPAPPADDAALVRLVDEIDRLEREVRAR